VCEDFMVRSFLAIAKREKLSDWSHTVRRTVFH
jgi:hypothetical protein